MVKASTNKKRKLSSLELFVGAGGLALGAAKAGFSHTTAIERDPVACDTLKINKLSNVKHVRDWDILEEDVCNLNFSRYRGIDLLSGGPPCQPFSQAGKSKGRSDKRDMFPEFIRAIRECDPKVFVIENVKGLVSRKHFDYFNYLEHQLRFPFVERSKGEKWQSHKARLERFYTGGCYKGKQYKVIHDVLNAANYGVAQRRERVFIVGIRADLNIEYNFPEVTHTRESLLHDQWVQGGYWDRHKVRKTFIPEPPANIDRLKARMDKFAGTKPWVTVRDVISDLPRIAQGRKSKQISNHFLNPGARVYKGHTGSQLDLPGKTIKAGQNGVPGGENMVCLDDGSVRYFSVRECARLQAFPDEWVFDGSWCRCMRQIGNAVPVTLGEVVTSSLATSLRA